MDTTNLPAVGFDAGVRELKRELEAVKAELAEVRRSMGRRGFTFETQDLTIRNEGALVVEDGGDIILGDGGQLRIEGAPLLDENGNPVVDENGEPVPSVDLLQAGDIGSYRGLRLRQPDGTYIMSAADDGVSIMDGRGNEVVATDRASGYGLDTPYMPWNTVYYEDTIRLPRKKVTGTGRHRVAFAEGPLWHPRLFFLVVGDVKDGPASGVGRLEVSIVARGVEIFNWISEPVWNPTFNDYVEIFEIADVDPRTYAQVYIYLHVDSGTGGYLNYPTIRGMGTSPY